MVEKKIPPGQKNEKYLRFSVPWRTLASGDFFKN